MKHFFLLKTYIRFLFKSQSKYSIHSPFVYELLTKHIKNRKNDEGYQKIKNLRAGLRQDQRIINIEDLGAGTRDESSMKIQRSIAEITKRTSVQDSYAKMLFRIVRYFKPQTILEFGTSLGISSSLFSIAAPESEIHTMEGSDEILQVAIQNFDKLGLKNIRSTLGDFDQILSAKLEEIGKLDFVFFDGNHQKDPTIAYFEKCLPYKHNGSIFVFDDIHWSQGMEDAWDYIKSHPETIVSIDLFFMGIVFFRKEFSKQDFIYKL